MNDQLPDFEPEQTTEPAAQPPKRRKPMRRKVRAVVAPAPKRRAVKAKVIRRGRPAGSKNKPKPTVGPIMKSVLEQGSINARNQHHGGRYTKPQYQAIALLAKMPAIEYETVLDIVNIVRRLGE